MSSESKQQREWPLLHDLVDATMQRFGEKNAFRKGDYWLLDENWGWWQQQLEVQNLNLLAPNVIAALQGVLVAYPDWQITIRVDVPGKEDVWPGMGLVIEQDGIVDDLQRQYLPADIQRFRYANVQGSPDRDVFKPT